MGPKKDAKNVVQQAPKQVQIEIPIHQLTGYGRFQYLNGVNYEGNWKLIKNIKVKQGYGKITLPTLLQNGIGQQYYEGNWEQDKMEGYGTYVYSDGTSYNGEWKDNKHHGKGILSFANGTHYEGEWQNHAMHGNGQYVDHLGRKWNGQFRNGVYESRKQIELQKQKAQSLRRVEIKAEIQETVASINDILQGNHQQITKNISHHFAFSDIARELIKEPLVKYEDKTKQAWAELLVAARTGQFHILNHRSDCLSINPEKIMTKQRQGKGQVVQVVFIKENQKQSLVFLEIQAKRWVLALHKDSISQK